MCVVCACVCGGVHDVRHPIGNARYLFGEIDCSVCKYEGDVWRELEKSEVKRKYHARDLVNMNSAVESIIGSQVVSLFK